MFIIRHTRRPMQWLRGVWLRLRLVGNGDIGRRTLCGALTSASVVGHSFIVGKDGELVAVWAKWSRRCDRFPVSGWRGLNDFVRAYVAPALGFDDVKLHGVL